MVVSARPLSYSNVEGYPHMDATSHSVAEASQAEAEAVERAQRRATFIKWGIVLLSGLALTLTPAPSGITPQSWRLLAIFVATIIGSILRPVPSGAVVLIGVATVAFTGALPVEQALRGYADPIVWLVLA